MKPSLEKLQKFFKLEAERGFDNHAVVGGLERMLSHWEAEARSENVPEEIVQMVVSRLRDYHRLSPVSRAEVLNGIWRRVIRSQDLPEDELSAILKPEVQPETSETPNAPQDQEETPERERPPQASPDKTDRNREMRPSGWEQAPQTLPAIDQKALNDLPPEEPEALGAPVTVLSGVGPKNAEILARLGIETLRDMLYYFPRRYDDYSQLKSINRLGFNEEITVIGTIQSVSTRKARGGQFQIVEAVVNDGTGALRASWFNQPWIGKRLRSGMHVVLSGKTDQYLGRLVMNNPEWEPLEQEQLSTNRIVPVYPLTANITQRWLRKMLYQVVSFWAQRMPEMLPLELRQSARLIPISQALVQVHFPDGWDELTAARYRLAFDEIFLLQLGVLEQKRAWQSKSARKFQVESTWLDTQLARLPFSLTAAQLRAIQDIQHDLATGSPMNRLLQGDVGSGKTIVAAMAVAIITRQDSQAALMAPTSILAEQHYRNLLGILCAPAVTSPSDNGKGENQGDPQAPGLLAPDQVRLLIGATPEAEKSEIRRGIEEGTIKLLIGTHALIEEPVQFSDLEMVIIDEQHRFGVEQRAALRSKGASPHLLVMTATPIPRSLALTVYGDLDLSVIDEMPPGRQEISTHVLPPQDRERVYNLIKSQVEKGQQAFIIYPLIEESEKSEAKAAVVEHSRLQKEIFPDFKVGLLHGRLRPEEKDQVMEKFRDGEFQVLVSTSVVEVGVDIPNATVMLIEGANRFGLAQLHQFRGRVGRGAEKSYCILIPDTPDNTENERLQVMAETSDGFVLAERDLEQRGPGQFLGTRQSGFNELQMANLTDVHIIENARRHAQQLFETNPELSGTEFAALKAALNRFWEASGRGDMS